MAFAEADVEAGFEVIVGVTVKVSVWLFIFLDSRRAAKEAGRIEAGGIGGGGGTTAFEGAGPVEAPLTIKLQVC